MSIMKDKKRGYFKEQWKNLGMKNYKRNML